MKMNMLKFWMCCAMFCASLCFVSCTKNDENTLVLIGEENYIDDILSVIPDTLKVEFMDRFGTIPEGVVPPRVEGEYVVAPRVRVASNYAGWPVNIPEPNAYIRFADQHNGVVGLDLNEATETFTDTVFVMGHDAMFTVYFIEDKNYDVTMQEHDYHISLSRGVVMKGEITDEGIKNFRYATIILDMQADGEGFELYSPGTYFIYKDGSNMAERFDW